MALNFKNLAQAVFDKTTLDEELKQKLGTAKTNLKTGASNVAYRARNPYNPAGSAAAFAKNIPQTQRFINRTQEFGDRAANFALNTANPFFSGIEDYAGGAKNFYSPQSDLLTRAKGTAQMIRGTGRILAPFQPSFQIANTVASTPTAIDANDRARRLAGGYLRGQSQTPTVAANVPRRETFKPNIPGIGQLSIDPVTTAGEMAGFVRNPINQRFFKATEAILPAKLGSVPLKKWIATTAARGGMEDFLLAMADIPLEGTTQDKMKFLLARVPQGVLSELFGQAVFQGGGLAANKVIKADAVDDVIKQLFDTRKSMIKVKGGIDPKTGERVEMPMWKWMMKDQTGGINNPKAQAFTEDISPRLSGLAKEAQRMTRANFIKAYGELFRGGSADFRGSADDFYSAAARGGSGKVSIPDTKAGATQETGDILDPLSRLRPEKTIEPTFKIKGDFPRYKLDSDTKIYRAVDSTNTGEGLGEGIYAGLTKAEAQAYGKNIEEMLIKKNANILDLRGSGNYQAFIDEARQASPETYAKLLADNPNIAPGAMVQRLARSLGYDGVVSDAYGTVIYNPDVLKGFDTYKVTADNTKVRVVDDSQTAKEFQEWLDKPVRGDDIKPMTVDDMPKTKKSIPVSDEEIAYKTTEAVMRGEEDGIFEDAIRKWAGQKDVARTEGGVMGFNYKEALADIPKDQESFLEFMDHVQGVSESKNPVIQKAGAEWKQDTDILYQTIKEQADRLGIDMGYVDKYATQYWNESPEKVFTTMQRLSKSNPSLKDRTFLSYREGVNAGLTPRYTDPAQVMAEYTSRLYRLKANLDLFDELKSTGQIVEGGIARKAPGFAPVVAPGFPKRAVNIDGKIVEANYYAPTHVATRINQLFSEQQFSKRLKATADATRRWQNITLSGGVPKTPINAFAIAQLQKELLSGRVRGPLKAITTSMSEERANKYFMQNADVIKEMQSNNVTTRTPLTPEGLAKPDSFGEVWDSLTADPTFKRFMPALQIEFYKDIKNQALKGGVGEDEAIKTAAKAAQSFYGLTDTYKQATSNVDIQNLKSTFVFAPYYREAMINFWKENVKALRNPMALENRANIKFLGGAAITFGVMNMLNQMFNGHPMWNNPDNKKDKLLIPVGDKTIGIPFLSSIATVPRLGVRVIGNLANLDVEKAAKDTFRTLSSSTISPLGDISLNEDYFGRQIYDPLSNRVDKAKAIGGYLSEEALGHPWLKAGIRAVKEPPTTPLRVAETISTAGEMPFRFYDTENLKNSSFWDKYNQAKALNERYIELKYKDPQKADEFYRSNQELIDAIPDMKGAMDLYYDRGDTSALQRYMGEGVAKVGAADTIPVVANIPTSEKELEVLYKQDQSIISGYEEKRIKAQYDQEMGDFEREAKLRAIDDEYNMAVKRQQEIISKQPDKIFSIEVSTFSKDGSASTEDRVAWAGEQLQGATDPEAMLEKLYNGQVLTKSVVESLNEQYGLGLTKYNYGDGFRYLGGSGGGSKSAKKISVKSANVSMPKISGTGGRKISLSSLNIAAPPKFTPITTPKNAINMPSNNTFSIAPIRGVKLSGLSAGRRLV